MNKHIIIICFSSFLVFLWILTAAIVFHFSRDELKKVILFSFCFSLAAIVIFFAWDVFAINAIDLPVEFDQTKLPIKNTVKPEPVSEIGITNQNLENDDDLFVDQLVGMSIFTSYALTVILTLWGF